MSMIIANLIRPFVALALIAFVAAPIKRYVSRTMPECALKRILFFSWRV